MSEQRIEARVEDGAGFVNLRGNPADEKFLAACDRALGQALPTEPNTVSAGAVNICWLGPDEWLVRAERDAVPGLVAALEDGLAGLHAAVNDLCGGNVAVRLTGSGVRDLLARGSTLDFHPRAFAVGRCAQTGLAKASVLVALLDDAPTFEIVVRRSFADYLLKWLRAAGHEHGIEFA